MSDELGLFAHVRPAIVATSAGAVIEAVAALVEADGIGEVVVGLPLSLAGHDSEQAAAARELTARLRARLGIPVTQWDERLSTAQAARQRGSRARGRTGELDSAAAALVLQAVLDSRRETHAP